MNTTPPVFLLDTSIQIKRLMSQGWKVNNLDSTWESVEPAASVYTWMEFKNSVIGALRFLISVLEEIKSAKCTGQDDLVKIRLGEVIQQLTFETNIREKERRKSFASAYAAKLLEENEAFPRIRGVIEVIDQLKFEAEDLEKRWFFFFPRNGEARQMPVVDRVNCELGRALSPLTDGRKLYHCRRDDLKCNVVQHIQTIPIQTISKAISDGSVRVRDTRLRNGIHAVAEALAGGVIKRGSSMGEKLCFPLGDAIIVSKAREEKLGLVTADGDQRALADHWGVQCIFYDSHTNSFSKKRESEK